MKHKATFADVQYGTNFRCLLLRRLWFKVYDTVKPLYIDIRYNDKICYNDNLNGTIL